MSSDPFFKFLGVKGEEKCCSSAGKSEMRSQKPTISRSQPCMDAGGRSSVISNKIEDIVLDVLVALKNGIPPRVCFFNRHIWENTSLENMIMKGTGDSCVTVDFANPQSRAHLALMFWLLSNLHHQMISGSSSLKREIFYKSLGILKSLGYPSSQSIVDSVMSDVGALLSLPLRHLGVLSSSRGLIAGDLQLLSSHSADLGASSVILDTKSMGNECCAIPGDIASMSNEDFAIQSSAKLVLIIEKDACFQKLLDDGILEQLKPCLLITGRGYPDVCTRRLVHSIWKQLNLPLLALVDADPHGVEIMLIYRFGSLAMSKDAEELAVPAVRWLGVHPSDIPNLGLSAHSLLPLGREGNAKAEALLTRPYVQAHPQIYNETVRRTWEVLGWMFLVLSNG
ncbi:meiotic recombination protein SPO11 isoform X2 [Ischnura elegans]|uniref:meiotic recombination protein SPO11 isoform X2 n=1 Tax=Ischnura elegans TaxID=197161 RepID=UPI001ED8A19A|nr:meiotic recombination protein SPO11 isoform X2 [Ischnura elegans]